MTTVLRAKRQEKGLSVRQMAAKLGCTPTHISDIERGNRQPGPYFMPNFLAAYGLTEDEAFRKVAVRYTLIAREVDPHGL